MSTTTTNLGLVLPALGENFDLSVWVGNMQKIDDEAVDRNQANIWASAMTVAQFISACEEKMGTRKGLSFLGYINYSVVEPWGLDFNGYVLGFYHNASYKTILIVSSGNNIRLGKIAMVNGVWDERVHQMTGNKYIPGDSMNAYCIGYGFVTDSGKTIRIIVPTARIQTAQVSPVLQAGCHFEIRGGDGYVDGFAAGNSTEVVGNSNYTVSVSRINEGAGLIIVLQKTTAFGNITNNTPITAIINPLKVAFNAPT